MTPLLYQAFEKPSSFESETGFQRAEPYASPGAATQAKAPGCTQGTTSKRKDCEVSQPLTVRLQHLRRNSL
jgi:hypothetical protein